MFCRYEDGLLFWSLKSWGYYLGEMHTGQHSWLVSALPLGFDCIGRMPLFLLSVPLQRKFLKPSAPFLKEPGCSLGSVHTPGGGQPWSAGQSRGDRVTCTWAAEGVVGRQIQHEAAPSCLTMLCFSWIIWVYSFRKIKAIMRYGHCKYLQ